MSYPPYGPQGADDRRPEPQGQPLPAELPPRPPTPGSRVGRAYGVALRQESRSASENAAHTLTVLEFRLGEPGNPRPLDVSMRGRSLSGTVRDGDWIEVTGAPDAMNRWDVAKVANLTTGSTVLALGGRRSKAGTVVVLTFLAVILLVFLVIIIGAVTALVGS